MLDKLRRYEAQASVAQWLAVAAVLPMLFAAWLVFSRYDGQTARIVYGAKGLFAPGFLSGLAASGAPAAVAFVLGWNSAGQRRNNREKSSWIGFFLGGGVLTADVIMVLAFAMLRLRIDKP